MGNLGTHAASVGIYRICPTIRARISNRSFWSLRTPMVLVTKKTLPVHTLADVIAWAKAQQGKATMGSAGVGSISHLTLLLFNHLTGADVTHVPYRGLSEATNDLLGGQIDMSVRSGSYGDAAYSQRQRKPHRRHDPDSARRRSPTCRRPTRPVCRNCKPSLGPLCSCRKVRRLRSSADQRRGPEGHAGPRYHQAPRRNSGPIFRRRINVRPKHSAIWSAPKSTNGCR